MSRREGRESDSRRQRSKFDREPSPKRPRRDGKPATERPSSNLNLDVGDHADRDLKHRQRLHDALPLEALPAPDSKLETETGGKELDKKINGQDAVSKIPSNPTEVPRSRSYFQHDERGNAGQAGRTSSRGAGTERRGRDPKDQHGDRAMEKTASRVTEQRNEKSQAREGDNRVSRHDGFHEIEADRHPPGRKRPAFREKKIEVGSENADKVGVGVGVGAEPLPLKPSRSDRPLLGSESREERGGQNPRYLERPEKLLAGDRDTNRGEAQRGSIPSRDRYDSGSNYRGRDRFNGRQAFRPGGVRVDRWKHDLFEEANKSPTSKNEEDQIAKVEALLAS